MKFSIKIIALLFLIITGCSKDDDETADMSNESELLTFSIKEISNSFTISSTNLVETSLTEEQDLTSLTAVFTISAKAKAYVGSTIQTSGYTKNDYSNPLTFTVEAEDGTKTNYSVVIYTEAKLKTYKIIELPSAEFIFEDLNISATVPFGTALDNLTAQFTVTDNDQLYIASTLQTSGQTKNNFEQPLVYSLKRNSTVEKQYTVNISVEENKPPVADAGSDKVVIVAATSATGKVNLDGSNSTDPEGSILTYEWKSGASVIATTEVAEVDFVIGVHNITLTVTDDGGATDSDEITAEVRVQGEYKPIDNNATQATKNLFTNLASIANSSQFAFGQEFPLSFKLEGISYDLNTSDCKDVSGDHPAVFGIDPHYMLYKTDEEKQLHIDEAKAAYDNGSVVTFDFHQQSKTDHKIYMNDITTATDKSLMYDVVNDNNGSRTWFYGELDEIIDIINNDLGFPIVFRLFHEMDGNWFWWGSNATNHSSQLYVDFYRLATDYIKDRSDLVLFGWSPNQQLDTSYYPGDAYVDVVGLDIYNPIPSTLKANLIELSAFAYNHGKVAVLSETGKNDYVNLSPKFWTSNVLSTIEDGGSDIKIAWTLAWFNAPWKSSQSDLFIPDNNSATNVKNDFVEFKSSTTTLFQQEINAMNMYD